MGICASAPEPSGPLEALLVAAVQGAKSRNGMRDGKMHTFNGLLMQFGRMRPGFVRMKGMFQGLAGPSMRIATLENKLDLLQIQPDNAAMAAIIVAAKAEGKGGIDGDE